VFFLHRERSPADLLGEALTIGVFLNLRSVRVQYPELFLLRVHVNYEVEESVLRQVCHRDATD